LFHVLSYGLIVGIVIVEAAVVDVLEVGLQLAAITIAAPATAKKTILVILFVIMDSIFRL